ncbi:MAG: FkbM family methyltransferase [Pirellulales bacterium]
MIAQLRRSIPQQLRDVARQAFGRKPAPPAPVGVPVVDPRQGFQIPFWYQWNHCEPTVSLALRDLCRPGDVVFDVGANAGSLSVLMSRLVGPRGIVCAFEASPRIIDKCQYNLAANGCSNVTLYHRAVCRESRQLVRVFAGPHLNDSIVQWSDSDESHLVPSVNIDDFIAYSGLVPKLIKMDIEGAEFDALQGMSHTLAALRPYLILEQSPRDLRCVELLRQHGYQAIDLATLRPVASTADFPPQVDVANVLYLPNDRIGPTPYGQCGTRREVARLAPEQFSVRSLGTRLLEPALPLEPGRYAIELLVESDSQESEVMCGVEVDGQPLVRYHANAHFLSRSYRHWVLGLSHPEHVQLFWRVVNEQADPGLRFRGATIERLESFDHWPAPLVE